MKRTVILSNYLPYPLISGGRQAIYNGIACLKDITEVFIIYPTRERKRTTKDSREIEHRFPFVTCVPYVLPASRRDFCWFIKRCRNKAFKLIGGKKPIVEPIAKSSEKTIPRIGFPILSDDYIHFVLSFIKKKRIDIVQVEMVENIRIIDSLPPSVKTVFVHHELRWVRNELLIGQIGESHDLLLEVEKAKKEEISYLNRYDSVIVLSGVDREKLQSAGVTTDILTSFAIVDGPFSLPSSTSFQKLLSFIGPSNHFPNYDGVLWFLKHCWKDLLSIDPEYRLQIIGNWEEKKMEDILSRYKNVEFKGFVDNLGAVIKDSVLIVPLNIGSGIRMKILEGARLGTPVVSTTIGAEGLPVCNDESILIADTADSFIRAILKLQDPLMRSKLVFSLQEIVKKEYSIEALKESRKSIYQ